VITRDLTHADILARALDPRWSWLPTSGAGAAKSGGRYNRVGLEAVYLSLDPATALAEYQQTAPFLPPATVASFHVVARVVDLTQFRPDDGYWDGLWAQWDTDWRDLLFQQHIEPPTWLLGDMAIAAGHHGILFPSVVHPGGNNVVLFPSTFGRDASLICLDPDRRLPQDDLSSRR
jgi:RES domain-containing protein